MSEEGENKGSREKATENLFNFSERDESRKDSLAEDDQSQVHYNEELSLQNIFIEKEGDESQVGVVGREAGSDAANDASDTTGSLLSDNATAAAAASGEEAGTVAANSAAEDSQLTEDGGALRSSALRMSQDARDETNAAQLAETDSAQGQAFAGVDSESETNSAVQQNAGLEPSNGLEAISELPKEEGSQNKESEPSNTAPNASDDATATVLEGAQTISGQLAATDIDQNAVLAYDLGEGVSAPEGFLFNADGSYSFDPSVEAYDHLNVGDSQVITVPFTVSDENGATDSAFIKITVTGTNDAPIAGADVFSSVDEGAGTIEGQLLSTDVDDSATASFAVSDGGELPDGFVLNSDGSYTFDPSNSAYEQLSVGDSQVLTIPITVTDEHGASDTSQIQITIAGTNDAPVAGAKVFATVDEGASVIAGQFTSGDSDAGAEAAYTIAAGSSAPEGFLLNSDGSYSFDPADEAYEHLNVGDSAVLTIPVTVTDDQGATDTSLIQITVVGTNDAPVAGADVAAKLEEGSSAIKGQLTSTDLDDDATSQFSITEGAETPAGFEMNADGTYSFDPSDEAYDHLNVGDSTVLTIPITVTDDQGATDTSQIQITVVGTNDAPVVGVDVAAKVEEGASAIKGQLTSTDLDDDATAKFSVTEGADAPAGFEMNADGTYSFDPSDEAYDHLNVGDSTVLTIPVTVTDDQGATDTSQIQITVVGTNDAPVAGATISTSIDEGAGSITGQMTSKDLDEGSTATYTVSEEGKVPEGFELNADGSYSFDANDDAYDHLAAGENQIMDIPVTVTDEHGATDTSNIQITVTGTNDAPSAITATGGTVAENVGAGTVVVELSATDADDGDKLSFSIADDSGLFEVQGDQIVVKDGAQINYESESEHTLTVQVTDAAGESYKQDITIEVTDINETPTDITLSSDSVNENAVGGTVVADLAAADEDRDESFTYDLSDESGLFEISGDQIVVKEGADIDFESDESHDISVKVTDSGGNTYTEAFTIGVNDIYENVGPVASDDTLGRSFAPENATLAAEINFDDGVPGAARGSITAEESGQVGSAADFSSAKLSVDGIDLSGAAGDQTTVSMWIQGNPEGSWEMLAASDIHDLTLYDGNIGFNTGVGDLFGSDASELADGEWHHVVGIFTNGDYTQNSIFIDGVPQEMSQIRGSQHAPRANVDSDDGTMHFGSWGVHDGYRFTGSMDEIKVFNGDLSPDEVTALYDIESGHDHWQNSGQGGTQEDTAVVIDPADLMANDVDADGDALTIVAVDAAEHGSVELTEDGEIVFTPDANYHGDASFTYTISDGNGGTDSATVTLDVASVNDLPVIEVVNTISVDEDGKVSVKYKLDDIDSESVTLEGSSDNGTVTINDDGTMTFTPDEDFNGDTSITLTATDSDGGVTTQTIEVDVAKINDAPVANDPAEAKVAEGGDLVSGQLTATDSDEGSTATWSLSEGADAPEGFALNEDGSYTFDPADEAYDHLNVGDSTTLNVPVTVTDDEGETDTSQIQITVSGTNDTPVVANHEISTQEGGAPVKGSLPASDVDDGAQLTFTASGKTPEGFTLNDDGSYEFDPSDSAYDGYGAGESHTEAVTYTVTDEHGESSDGVLYVGVEGTNDKVSMVVDTDPENNTIPENAVEGSPVGLVAKAEDADGDEVSYSLVDSKGDVVEDGAFAVDAKSGVVTVNDPSQIDYEDSTSHDLNIQATSADGSTSVQGFSVEVTDVHENVGPDAGNDIGRIWVSESTNEIVENLQVGTFEGEHADVSDWGDLVDGKAVFQDGDVTITTSVSEGELTAYNKAGHVGFGIGNEDRQGLDKSETLTVEIDGADANRVEFTLSGLGGWFDESSRNATEVQITAYDQNGDLIETQGGYRTSGSYEDTYSFETETPVQRFEITSEGSTGTFVVQNMTLSSTDIIETPGHWENVTEDGTITIDVLANDTDLNGDELSIVGVESQVMEDGVLVGTAEIVEVDGVQKIQFTPDESMQKMSDGESQNVSFEYKISDGEGGTDTAKVSLTVEGVDDDPKMAEPSAKSSAGEASTETEEIKTTDGDDKVSGTEEDDVIKAQDGDDKVAGEGGNDEIHGGAGDDVLSGGAGDDKVWGGDGNDTYIMESGGGSDYFDGGAGGGWTDSIQLTANPDDGDSPWSITVDGEQVEYDLAAGALELQPDTSGIITLADGSELTFDGIESINW